MRERASAAVAGAVTVALAAVVFAIMAFVAGRGLDVVDESYLLRMVDNPQATRRAGDVYLFGFLVHPLYLLVGEDVARLRLLGFAVVAAVAAVLCHESLALLRARGAVLGRSHVRVATVVVATSSLLVFCFDVTVPAYRSVALVGLMLTAAGMARVMRGDTLVGGAAVGAGGWLIFVGKPTSAAALVVLVLLVVVAARLASSRFVTAALCSTVVAAGLTLLVARLSPAQAVDYLVRGTEGSSRLGNHSGVAMMLGLTNLRLEGLVVLGPAFLLPLVVTGVREQARGGRGGHRSRTVELGYAVAMLIVTSASCLFAARWLGPMTLGWQVFSLALVLPLVAATLLVRRRTRLRADALFVGFLLVLPWVSAVGSNVAFTVGMSLAAVFWVLALVVVSIPRDGAATVAPVFGRVMLLAAAVSLTMTVAEQTNGLPGGDLLGRLQPAEVAGGTLLLPPGDAAAAGGLRAAARHGGLGLDTPVVDLTGVGAGYAFLAGGRPIGRAHLYADLPDSLAAARASLDTATCGQRAAAWVVRAPSMGIGITPALTRGLVSLDDDYEVMARFTSRQARGTWEMELLRPTARVPRLMGC